jgi:phosphomevalonate kinase
MKAFAPGKMLLSGAYAVLHGAPAVVLAVSRGAVADTRKDATHVSDEVLAALAAMGDKSITAPHVSVSALFEGDKKLGLGASAAGLVAALGALARLRHDDIRTKEVRARIFLAARDAHASAQSGGSGVDIAASVHGGLLVYTLQGEHAEPLIQPLAYPQDLVVEAFFSGRSASTKDMRARVDALATREPARFSQLMSELSRDARDAHAAMLRADVRGFVGAVRAQLYGLSALGREADAPIVLPAFMDLDGLAQATAGVFTGSGAGGGDIALYMGPRPSSHELRERAIDLGLSSFAFERDALGLSSID